ncbi:MAG: hypothetical protein CL508_05325 [Actinobacteria bacterium]|nr:hypothetical protein [Actinomycetota bacterium]|tara:strand:+ start:606 stop:1262 length:657 start_codon:yes stop_codon:yes gene_type:complete
MTLKLNGSSSGSVSIDAPATTAGGADRTLTLPDDSGNGVIKTSTYPSSLQVLEEFGSPCDGSVIATSNGDVTFPNVTAAQVNTGSYEDVNGSVLAYNPPTGTTQVHYSFDYFTAEQNDPQLAHWKLFLDSDEVTKARRSSRFIDSWAGNQAFRWVFNIGGTADTTVGRVTSWTSAKTMKLQWREYGSSYNPKLHETVYWDGTTGAHLAMPTLSIKAIG